MEVHALPEWNPLPTRGTFVHFDEDLWQKAWLGRSVSCPWDFHFLPAGHHLHREAERTPAAASTAGPRGSPLGAYPGPPPPRVGPASTLEARAGLAATRAKATPKAKAGLAKDWINGAASKAQSAPPHAHTAYQYWASKVATKAAGTPPAEERHARRDASPGDWQVVRAGKSTGGPRDTARLPEAVVEDDSSRWSNMSDDQPSKDQQKWAVVQKGGHHRHTELVEEEDAQTDTTGSTGPGGEEVTSGASTSGKEQGSRVSSKQPPQVSEADNEAGADGEAEDGPVQPDDGWTEVPAQRKRKERKEPARSSPIEIAMPWPKLASASSHTQRRPGTNRAASDDAGAVGPAVVATAVAPSGSDRSNQQAPIARVVASADQPTTNVGQRERRHGGLSRSTSNGESLPKAPVEDSRQGPRMMTKYKVGIKQDDGFNLMRRLLVPGGGHIKRIALATGAKLTVRGEGSGHGVEMKDEPLAICICSAYPSSLDNARLHTEELILQLHEDYRTFCRSRSLSVPQLIVHSGETSSW